MDSRAARPLPHAPRPGSTRDAGLDFKTEVRAHYDRLAPHRDRWYHRNAAYHAHVEAQVRRFVAPGGCVLELGCATGNLLASLEPGRGRGIDLSPAMIAIAASRYPRLAFEVQDAETVTAPEPFDAIVCSDVVGELLDITAMLDRVQALSHDDTRLVITFHNPALEGILRLAQRLGLALPPARQNWIGPKDLETLLDLSDFEVEHAESSLLVPVPVPVLDRLNGSAFSRRRGIRYFNLVNLIVARPVRPRRTVWPLSCTVVVPCRNEVDNIEAAVTRIPAMGSHTEILFVDGASTDGTQARIESLRREYAGRKDIKLIEQVPQHGPRPPTVVDPSAPVAMLRLGKGDAVRKGFAAATGDVLMILDADLTVPPEDLPRFFRCLAAGKGEFVNGSRLLYPMEEKAMKFVNYLGNKFFSVLFTWLLGQRVRDTLCGTKALRREAYERIQQGRAYFGEFDPFGDFDLLFGAARLRLRIVEVPVRYRRRVAGVSKVRVWRHGWLLLGMSLIAFRKFKVTEWLGR